MAAYTVDDLSIRKAWMAETISDNTEKLLQEWKYGNIESCKCLEKKIQMSMFIRDIICLFDPEEDYNHLTEEQVDNLVNQFSDYFKVCFAPKGIVL